MHSTAAADISGPSPPCFTLNLVLIDEKTVDCCSASLQLALPIDKASTVVVGVRARERLRKIVSRQRSISYCQS